jgi:hypothetical protein
MSSLYAQYIKERENFEIVESEKGFTTYQIYENGECYIRDIFVAPEFRNTKISFEMEKQINDIAKLNNCNFLIGSICLDAKNPSKSLQILLNDQWQVYKTIGNMIFVKKEVQ